MLLELTFIVLARPLEPPPSDAELTSKDIEALPMIGDVDFFFKNSREDPEFEVEYEVMIAGRCSSSTPILLPPYLLNAHPFLPSPAEPVYRGQRVKHRVVCEPWLRGRSNCFRL